MEVDWENKILRRTGIEPVLVMRLDFQSDALLTELSSSKNAISGQLQYSGTKKTVQHLKFLIGRSFPPPPPNASLPESVPTSIGGPLHPVNIRRSGNGIRQEKCQAPEKVQHRLVDLPWTGTVFLTNLLVDLDLIVNYYRGTWQRRSLTGSISICMV